jgi:hypothetical protein
MIAVNCHLPLRFANMGESELVSGNGHNQNSLDGGAFAPVHPYKVG